MESPKEEGQTPLPPNTPRDSDGRGNLNQYDNQQKKNKVTHADHEDFSIPADNDSDVITKEEAGEIREANNDFQQGSRHQDYDRGARLDASEEESGEQDSV
ncbi:MAG: hypothetical protein V4714_23145 [Bacteroidota bacterium]